ncbi:MAG: phage major capsid protein [Lachnospiraceae bacterium]|nr:phage major capsid protein [Lachnospiraceae bacterium]
MPGLLTSSFEIPNNISAEIFKKAQSGSTIARLSASKPQKFGKETTWVLTGAPKAELVGEGAQKSPTPTTYAPKTITPLKLQVTMRFSQEVKWADEDTQIGILKDMGENCGIALGRALDLVGFHKINPLTGTVSALVPSGLTDSTLSATLANGKYDELVEAGAGAVIGAGYTPTGIAMDPVLSFGLSTQRDNEGRKLYPGIGFGQGLTEFMGMSAAVSDTVSGKNELAVAGSIIGIVGQWDAIRWGVQRMIMAHMIEYGDPDGLGDLQRMNQIALRMEIVYGLGILADEAFAKLLK